MPSDDFQATCAQGLAVREYSLALHARITFASRVSRSPSPCHPCHIAKHVEFISDMDWRQVHSEVAMGVRPTQNNPKRPSKVVRIKTIEDPKHPAYKQRGLFANQTIKPNTRIIDYVGVVRATCEESKTSDYIIQFTNQLSIDAERRGNEARFINDYRGTNGNVNVHFKTYPHHQGFHFVSFP
eukprot:1393420-Amorphochlora_amoeboformis.AAC.1